MKSSSFFLLLCLALPGQLVAQTTNTNTTLFKARFRAVEQMADTTTGVLSSVPLADRDVIADSLGRVPGSGGLRNYSLVYDAAADALEVVDASGTVIKTLLQFGGGGTASDTASATRLAFVFVPGQSNAIGTAVFTQRSTISFGSGAGMTARFQLVLPGPATTGNLLSLSGLTNTLTTATNTAGTTNAAGTNITSVIASNPTTIVTDTNTLISGSGTLGDLTAAVPGSSLGSLTPSPVAPGVSPVLGATVTNVPAPALTTNRPATNVVNIINNSSGPTVTVLVSPVVLDLGSQPARVITGTLLIGGAFGS